nr:isochorismatase family protein [Moritella sp. 5]
MEHGSEGWALQSSLITQSGDHFVRKTTPDSFLNTSLQSLLKELEVDSLIVCGFGCSYNAR